MKPMNLEVYKWSDITHRDLPEDPTSFTYGDALYTIVRSHQVTEEVQQIRERLVEEMRELPGDAYSLSHQRGWLDACDKVLTNLACLSPSDLICFDG